MSVGLPQYVFGPVPSRRLGRSLGVDTVPLKTCNWNCVYCQLGRTRSFTTRRGSFSATDAVVREVKDALDRLGGRDVDWITFVASGEPLLDLAIGREVESIKQMTDVPVAVITNGSLLRLPEVRRELLAADAVLPSVDAGSPALYRRINRPHPSLGFQEFVDGLVVFRSEFAGKLWLEVMLVAGLNDGPDALADLTRVLDRIRPDAVHVNTPVRPPAESWAAAPSPERVEEAVALFGRVARAVPPHVEGDRALAGSQGEHRPADGGGAGISELADTIAAVIGRHPMDEKTLSHVFRGSTAEEIRAALDTLISQGRAQSVTRFGVRFYGPAGARYAADSSPRS